MRVLLACGFLLLIGRLAPAAELEQHPRCDPAPEVTAVLDRAAKLAEECGEGSDCWNRRRELLERALAERPDDLFLHREYQDLFLYSRVRDARALAAEESARYAALADEHPESAAYWYLRGRVAHEADEARASFERAVEEGPDFPWGHLGLTSAYVRWGAGDEQRAGAGRHLRRFMELCPWRVEGLSYAERLDDAEFVRQSIARLRAHPERLTPAHYRQIWRLEFRLEPPVEHEAVRRRVRADLDGLTASGDADSKAARRVILEGYELLGDAEGVERIQAEEARRDPCSPDAVRHRVARWEKETPRPGGNPESEERHRWSRLHYEVTKEWVDQCPGSFEVRLERFNAVAGLGTSSESEVLSSADAWLDLWERDAAPLRMSPSPPALVARLLLWRKVGLERIPRLVERAWTELDRDYENQGPGLPEEVRRQIDLMHHASVNELRGILGATYLELGRVEEARFLLFDMQTDLGEHFTDTSSELDKMMHDDLAYEIARLEALMAEKEDRDLDAIVFHRRAASLTARPEEHLRRATELWQELGGSDAAWQALAEPGGGAVESFSGWRSVDEPLAPFELPDLGGATWRLSDLAGKRVFANLWATWCGPCRQEMPFVQALYERVADRQDVAVITFNMDENPGLVAPYLEESAFTLPVLLARDYLRLERGVMSIPRNWIIGPDGTLLREQLGFRGDQTEEQFVTSALEALDGAE